MILLSVLSLVGLAIACADDELHARDARAHAHVHEKREYPQVPLTPPYRPLVWGDFNVIHTTDTHGWLLGHQHLSWPEPNYSGDLGDFSSFVAHMKNISIEKDVDLLLVDSGDLHDGTGLSDGYPPGGVDGHESNKFIARLPYDIMTIGNHELLKYSVTYDTYKNFILNLGDRYLSSNANITIFDSSGHPKNVSLGDRYRKFTTRKGRKVTALGVMYNFARSDVNTTVEPVEKMVKEEWFGKAIAEEPDVFVLAGHMPVSNNSWPVVRQAIRNVHPYTPIMIFGGHSHIRDCQQYGDGRTMALQSGRYMETIGWMSANVTAAKGNTNDVSFTRRYLDQNRVTYQYHTVTSNSTFDTKNGTNITHGLEQLAANYNLGYFYGNASQDYTWNRDPYPSAGSLLTLYITEAAPFALAQNNSRAGVPNIIIINSELLRFDVLKGNFTKNDQLSVVPPSETDRFFYIRNVTFSIANQVLPALNGVSASSKREEHGTEVWGGGQVESRYQVRQTADPTDLTLGYVTQDGCPDKGDDTQHVLIPAYKTPHYVGSNPPNVTSDTLVDLVFLDYIQDRVLKILNTLQKDDTYTRANVSLYTHTMTNAVLGLYAQAKWN